MIHETASVIMPVLIRHDWQRRMTQHAIDLLRSCTEVPFELVVAEASDDLESLSKLDGVDQHHGPFTPGNATIDINNGIKAASHDLVVYTGNDVFVRPGWLEAVLAVFQQKDDAGIVTLASGDLRGTQIGSVFGQEMITEGIYGPFQAFDRRVLDGYDAETFPGPFADSDLVMRCYENGLRAYRNNAVVIEHINRQTCGSGQDYKDFFEQAKATFIERWAPSGLIMARILIDGHIV